MLSSQIIMPCITLPFILSMGSVSWLDPDYYREEGHKWAYRSTCSPTGRTSKTPSPNKKLNTENTQINFKSRGVWYAYLQPKCRIKMFSFSPTENHINCEWINHGLSIQLKLFSKQKEQLWGHVKHGGSQNSTVSERRQTQRTVYYTVILHLHGLIEKTKP